MGSSLREKTVKEYNEIFSPKIKSPTLWHYFKRFFEYGYKVGKMETLELIKSDAIVIKNSKGDIINDAIIDICNDNQ